MNAPSIDREAPGRHERLAVLDRYVRIPTLSRAVTAEMVEAVGALWREQGLDLEPLGSEDGGGTPAPGHAARSAEVVGARRPRSSRDSASTTDARGAIGGLSLLG